MKTIRNIINRIKIEKNINILNHCCPIKATPSVKLEVQHGQVFLESTRHEGDVPFVFYLEQHVGMPGVFANERFCFSRSRRWDTELRRADDVTVGCAESGLASL